ncbi:MAG: DNA-processing protein DprA [Nitrospirota bacterium]
MTTIEISDVRYPVLLRNIPDPPPVLYVDGELEPVDVQAVAIVGARHATLYGIRIARTLAEELSRLGFTIVSGMARGIDRVAHEGALAAGGRTLAVLGCGLDVDYPPDHTQLRAQVAEAGALLTEFPLGSPPLAAHFPRRNRILSGLSLGVVVVEAAEGSGSLITAKLAAEQGREVFAVPGPIDAPTSRGTHGLLKQGAKLTETVDDILDELLPQLEKPIIRTRLIDPLHVRSNGCPDFGISQPLLHPARPAAAGTAAFPGPRRASVATQSRPSSAENRLAPSPGSAAGAPEYRPSSYEPANLSPEEEKVYAVVSCEPQSIDELSERAALASSRVVCALLSLELKDAVRQAPGQRYHRSL